MPRLSILIPVLDKIKALEDTLVSILENRPANCQIVVVLSEPYSDPYQLRDEVYFVRAAWDSDLVESINFGLANCRAPIIHILPCGMEVSPGWTDSILHHFIDPKVASVAPLVLQRQDRNKTVSAGVGYRAGGKVRRLGYGKTPEKALRDKERIFGADLLAAFYRLSALEAVNGLNPNITGYLAGVDLALALHFAGFRCVREPISKMYVDLEEVAGGGRLGDGRVSERLFWKWASRMGWFKALSGHTVLVAGECLESMVRPATLLRLCSRGRESLRFSSHSREMSTAIAPAPAAAHPIAAPHFAAKRRRQSATRQEN